MEKLILAMCVMMGLGMCAVAVEVSAQEKWEKEFTVENKYLVMPIQNKGKGSTIKLYIDGKAVLQYGLNLAPAAEQTDWYAFFTIGNYKGKKARLEATTTEEGFALIQQSDTIPGEENIYKEPHRPQFHFTQKVGWNNDPNGMVYQNGKWNFFYQHNPVGLPWGNMTWGHATSKDLLHWDEQPDKLFPKTMCKGDAFSGNATVDKNNTAGWGKNTLVAFLTDTGCGECIAYSTDNGETFTYYDKNPVVKHNGRDPMVSWYAYGKDDKPLNDEAKKLGGHWVMVVYDVQPQENVGRNAAFYTSTNLKDWTEQSHLPGYYECTNLFELPVDGDAKNTRWVVFGADARYAVGKFDGKTFTPEYKDKLQVHYGPYYASQVFNNSPDGRIIQIGWVQVEAPGPYNQHFSFPHCLTLRKTEDGIRMFATPIKEIEKLHAKTNKAKAQTLTANKPLDLPVGSDLLDIRLTVGVGNAETIELSVPGGTVKYDVKAGKLNDAEIKPVDGKISLQVLVDRALMEIVGNGGRVYISGAGPGKKVDVKNLSVTVTGGDAKLVQFEAYEMKSIWTAAISKAKVTPKKPAVKVGKTAVKPSSGDAKVVPTDPNELKPVGNIASETKDLPKELAVDLDGGVKLEMVLIPAGSFNISGEGGGAIHKVNITKPFYMGKYEVTQEQWEKVMDGNPSQSQGLKNPVEKVSWDDCQKFLDKLNAKAGGQGSKFVLPTDAQWEYACRAGSTTKYCFGDDASKMGEYAWFVANSAYKTHPVGEKKPNAWGLYDMHGNVWEWCQDWQRPYTSEEVTDPSGPATGFSRVFRGGCMADVADGLMSFVRESDAPGTTNVALGFRVSRSMIPVTSTSDDAKVVSIKLAQLDIRAAGEVGVRVTIRPLDFKDTFPYTPALIERNYPKPVISLRKLDSDFKPVSARVGNLNVTVQGKPLSVLVTTRDNKPVQKITFAPDGTMSFALDDQPVLGMGEGGPKQTGDSWRTDKIELDRRGRLHPMTPWYGTGTYGSYNPVPLMIGTAGWGLFIPTPWGAIDLSDSETGKFIPADPIPPGTVVSRRQQREGQIGMPPPEYFIPGTYDVFVFDAQDPAALMKDISTISGQAVLPPKWVLGYQQSHRTVRDEAQMLDVVDTFREKSIPLDSVCYLGTGFCPSGWNKNQPSFEFNPGVFKRDPKEVLADMHQRNVKVMVHMIPWDRDRLETIQGTIPPKPGEKLDNTHIQNYWNEHNALVDAGVDAWWPDEGDWFNFHERMKRHELYYTGPLSKQPNVRPWSLHRNGYLGVARWGGWMWPGDPLTTWRTLQTHIAIGINDSLSVSPFWNSDIGAFYTTDEYSAELYVRWVQFAAFNSLMRCHGRGWENRLPWAWGLSEPGPGEGSYVPPKSELNNPTVEPIVKKYIELRYQLLAYNYTLAWQARTTGMPMMRSLWLHYPKDKQAIGIGDEYLWGRDMLIAPVYNKSATSREVYLPEGTWYDWWTRKAVVGGKTITRQVDLSCMPIYVRAGAIIPFDPVRQYTSQAVDEPTTLQIYRGADGQYTLYDDDGISLDYLKGDAVQTLIKWDDSAKRLTLEPSAKQKAKRTFRIELIPDGVTKEIRYTGQRLDLGF